MENLPTYRLTQSGPEAQEILDQVNLNTVDIEQLKRLYQALNQSEPEIIEPTDTWPVANPEENVIYRVIDRENTPPQYYTDYMWNGTSMVPMAKYDNAIDNEPTANSNNLVKSGGVYSFVHANGGAYDISAAHAVGGVLATYDDLADALGTNGANVPAAVRKGGMSIKFVLSSDNKYVRCNYLLEDATTNSKFTNVNNWQWVDSEPILFSKNLVASDGVKAELLKLEFLKKREIEESDLANGTWKNNGTFTSKSNALSFSAKKAVKKGDYVYVDVGSAIKKWSYKFWNSNGEYSGGSAAWETVSRGFEIVEDGYLVLQYTNENATDILPSAYDATSTLLSIPVKYEMETEKVIYGTLGVYDLEQGGWDDAGEKVASTSIISVKNKVYVSQGDVVNVTIGSTVEKWSYKFWNSNGEYQGSNWLTENGSFTAPSDGVVVIMFAKTTDAYISIDEYDAVTKFWTIFPSTSIEQGSWSANGYKQNSDSTIRTNKKIELYKGAEIIITSGNVTGDIFYRFFPYSGDVIQPDGWKTGVLEFVAPSDGKLVCIFGKLGHSGTITPSEYDASVYISKKVSYKTYIKENVEGLNSWFENLVQRTHLNEPLQSINAAQLPANPQQAGRGIVWNGSAWVYGSVGDSSVKIVNPYIGVFKSIPATEIPTEFQSMTKVGNEFWIATGGSGAGSGTLEGYIYRYDSSWNYIGKMPQSGFHFNSMSYDEVTDRLISGEAGDGSQEIYIFNNVSSWSTNHASTPITSADIERTITISQVNNRPNPVWAERNAYGHRDIIISANLNKKFIKIKLGYGTEQLSNGTYTASASGVPNGTYDIIWNRAFTIPSIVTTIGSMLPYSATVCQDIEFYKGKIYVMTSAVPTLLMELTPTDSYFETRVIYQLWSNDSGTIISNCANEGIMHHNGSLYCGIAAIGMDTTITDYNNKILKFEL